jgi:hypothetical protein
MPLGFEESYPPPKISHRAAALPLIWRKQAPQEKPVASRKTETGGNIEQNEKPRAVRGAFFNTMKRMTFLAGLAATYSSKP